METVNFIKKIEEKIKLLEKGREILLESAKFKAESISNYHRKFAVVLIRLKNGKSLSLDGDTIQNPPATYARDIAKGICWEEELQMELATAENKANLEKLESVRAELNGYQSANKWLESN